jgi:hypothetical protein
MTFRGGVFVGLVVFVAAAIAIVQFPHVRVWSAACRAVPEAERKSYDDAMELSARADSAVTAGNYSSASDLLDVAVSRLGNAYVTVSAATDDTDLVLQAGRDKSSHFDFQLAARMKQSALHTRLSMFRSKADISARCHALLRRIHIG